MRCRARRRSNVNSTLARLVSSTPTFRPHPPSPPPGRARTRIPEHQGASRSASPVALDQRPVPAATMGAWNVRGDPRRDGTHANRHRSSASWATCPTPCRNASSSLPSTATALPRASRSSRRACTRSCFARATSTSSGSTRCGTCSSRSFTSLAPFTYSASCNGCTRGRARGSCRGRWGAASWACRCSCRRL